MSAKCGIGINLAWSGKGSWSDEKLDGDDIVMMQRLTNAQNEQRAQVGGIVSSNVESLESIVRSVCSLAQPRKDPRRSAGC